MSCELCDAIAQTGDVVFEDDHTFVVLHNDWSIRGHAMIVAKRHVENPSDLYEHEWLHFARVWQHAERVLKELTHADRVIAMKLGLKTPHLHVHLYPVSESATLDEVFDIINTKVTVPRDETFILDTARRLNEHSFAHGPNRNHL
ncbi:MAG TPA: HIT family protein [Thermoanaerobaculia bacterium]|nr:HIT family protein [Thermoanaerobaculia bacterium]